MPTPEQMLERGQMAAAVVAAVRETTDAVLVLTSHMASLHDRLEAIEREIEDFKHRVTAP